MSKAFVSGAELRLENEIFDGFRSDMNVIIRELLKNMIEKGSEDGKNHSNYRGWLVSRVHRNRNDISTTIYP